jgi:hypothetical protein
MSDFDRNLAARTGYRADQVAIDAGLRAHMIRLYNYMASGVALTGLVAWLTYSAAVITGDPWRGVALNWPTKPPAVPAAGISAPSSAARGAAGPVLFDERNAARFERGLNFPYSFPSPP